jgi:HAMP domain-containing protein
MSPQDLMEFAKLAIMGLAILIPITGVTVRFALRPLVEAKARMIAGSAQPEVEQRLDRIEADVASLADLRVSLDRLTDELEFQRKLALPPADALSASVGRQA